jgi:hypothetical protein
MYYQINKHGFEKHFLIYSTINTLLQVIRIFTSQDCRMMDTRDGRNMTELRNK